MSDKGIKFDQEKPRTDLIPPSAVFSMAKVFAHGAKKYGDRNWENGIEFSRLFGAVQRHLWSWFEGDDIDESGLNHLEHALTSLAMLNEMRIKRQDLDDRPEKKHFGEIIDRRIKFHPTTNGFISVDEIEG